MVSQIAKNLSEIDLNDVSAIVLILRRFESCSSQILEGERDMLGNLPKNLKKPLQRLFKRAAIVIVDPARDTLERLAEAIDALCETPEGCELWRGIQEE